MAGHKKNKCIRDMSFSCIGISKICFSNLMLLVLVLISLLSLSLIYSCSSTFKLRKIDETSSVIQFISERYDGYSMYFESIQPAKAVPEILDIYEGYLKEGAPIVQKRLSEYVDLTALNSIRKKNTETTWFTETWNIKGVEMTEVQELHEGEKKIFLSNVLFDATFNMALIYIEFRNESSSSGSLVSLRRISNGNWSSSPSVPIYSGDSFSLRK